MRMTLVRGAANFAFTYAWTAVYATYTIGSQLLHEDGQRFRDHEREWASVLARGWDMQVELVGREKLENLGPVIFMGNHQSQVDPIALFVALPEIPGFLAKKELRRVPFLGRAMEVGGHVFIDRGNREQAIAAVDEAGKVIRAGASVLVFPEGTRTQKAEIGPFKKGPFHLAKQAGVPILPFGLRGTRDILPKHSKIVRAGKVQVHIGDPISAAEIATLDVAQLSERVRATIAELAAMPLAQI